MSNVDCDTCDVRVNGIAASPDTTTVSHYEPAVYAAHYATACLLAVHPSRSALRRRFPKLIPKLAPRSPTTRPSRWIATGMRQPVRMSLNRSQRFRSSRFGDARRKRPDTPITLGSLEQRRSSSVFDNTTLRGVE